MNLPNFIVNGVCKKGEEGICNIGYACDACPYNKDDEVRICYCCHKEKKESEGDWIVASIDKTSGSIEKRFVCKKCNHERT